MYSQSLRLRLIFSKELFSNSTLIEYEVICAVVLNFISGVSEVWCCGAVLFCASLW